MRDYLAQKRLTDSLEGLYCKIPDGAHQLASDGNKRYVQKAVPMTTGLRLEPHGLGIGLYTANASSPHDHLSLRPVAFSQDFP
jgi:hypothetical protein